MKGAKMKLSTRNFTLLILGQASSLLGNGALRFAVSMYVLDATGSAGTFSLIVALSMLPMIVLSPLGGVLADRADRRRIMVALDALSGLTVLLGALTMALGGGVAAVGVLLIALSVLGAFESPTVQACVPQMLSGENVLRGNAAVSQVQAVTSLVTPFLGAAAYSAFGLGSVMLTAAACFFLTALLECFIRLGCTPRGAKGGVLPTVRNDLAESARFLRREQPDVLKLLLLSGAASMFLSGVMVVGYPYLVRTTLGLSSAHYGVAESAAGVAAWMRRMLGMSGVAVLVAGVGFALGLGAEFVVLVAAFSLANMACSAFSVCAMTAIQRRTPESLTGKVMAFVYTLSLCAQPLGQLLYGALFDALPPAWVLIPSGAVVAAAAIVLRGFFAQLDLP